MKYKKGDVVELISSGAKGRIYDLEEEGFTAGKYLVRIFGRHSLDLVEEGGLKLISQAKKGG